MAGTTGTTLPACRRHRVVSALAATSPEVAPRRIEAWRLEFSIPRRRPLKTSPTDQARLLRIAAVCQEAIQEQRDREARHGYGLDDYTEGRIVGAANLARKIMRTLTGQPEPPKPPLRRSPVS